ncbi:MAG: hydantoinase B/oxoprolinase family protein [Gammaproteobacteria bacterium]|nr:hydantoinase B/oxoprolinase family protein [Gammaproteobacteria bacterium]
MNPIEVNLFSSRVSSICNEMGLVLRRAAFSPNIKDRLDFSCALFGAKGELLAQADHMPVHLGSMAFAMSTIVDSVDWKKEDVLVFNDPFLGGTHLPDVTLVSPVFEENGENIGFVANRAHHANIGCDTPGSMPVSSSLEDEGIVIPPTFLMRDGKIQTQINSVFTTPSGELGGDFAAQAGANQIGVLGLKALVGKLGSLQYIQNTRELNNFAERISLKMISELSPGTYFFEDCLDDDGYGNQNIKLSVRLSIDFSAIEVDFSDSADMITGNLNCPNSVAAAAALYCFRCLMPSYAPVCEGLFRRIKMKTRRGSIVDATRPAAVAAGNVETSSRLVDIVFGALAQAAPLRIAAASQGTMNNISMGQLYSPGQPRWDYYETIAGGMGGGPNYPGLDGIQTHMTNTLNTPVESLEMHYPLRIKRYELRLDSGGEGDHKGGDGVIREYEFLRKTTVSLLTERRASRPWGLHGAGAGRAGINVLNGRALPAKSVITAEKGDRLAINTPGGGGWNYWSKEEEA